MYNQQQNQRKCFKYIFKQKAQRNDEMLEEHFRVHSSFVSRIELPFAFTGIKLTHFLSYFKHFGKERDKG